MKSNLIKKVDVIFGKYTQSKYTTLDRTLNRSAEEIIEEITSSGLKGRGGAGFPTGLKWKLAKNQESDQKYVVCNADEGEPGTFKDRELLTLVPRKVLAGMAICGKAVGADKGFIYLRGEYNYMEKDLQNEIDIIHDHIKDHHFKFHIEIKLGSGAYICGEETALFESMEGKRGEPRNKPPFPSIAGFNKKPTVINNVETFATVQVICKIGAEEYKKLGTQDSRGSKLFCISGDSPNPGIYEIELGMPLTDFVNEYGDDDTKAVQVGGASGYCVPHKKFKDTIIGFEGIPTGGSMMCYNSTRSMYNVLHDYLKFFTEESCGQCTPCRVGCQQLLLGIESVKKGVKPPSYLEELKKLAQTMKIAAKCGLGQSVSNPFNSIVDNFREEIIY